jgi:hypothetical protein
LDDSDDNDSSSGEQVQIFYHPFCALVTDGFYFDNIVKVKQIQRQRGDVYFSPSFTNEDHIDDSVPMSDDLNSVLKPNDGLCANLAEDKQVKRS